MLEKLRNQLQQLTPQRLDHVVMPEAAVLLPIVDRPAPTLLFTRRASHLSTHSGQVAFPGGKREPFDTDLYATALREAEEEIGLDPTLVQPLGRLSDVISLHGIRVTPWVGIIPPDLPLVADPGELDAIFEVPLSHFLDDHRTHTDVITVDGVAHYVPIRNVKLVSLLHLLTLPAQPHRDPTNDPQCCYVYACAPASNASCSCRCAG